MELVEREAGPIHLVVPDVVMPHMSGPELASSAMAICPSLKVLYVSGLMGKTVVCEGAVVPGAVVLHKRFTAEGLARKVREVLEDQAKL